MRVQSKLSRRERTALIFCVAFILATVALSFFDKSSLLYSVRVPFDNTDPKLRYTGTIVVPDQPTGRCSFTQYDNKTSEFRGTEYGECFGKPDVNSPFFRMNALRDTFKK